MITSVPVFIGLTVVLFGGCAFMTGQALATTWRPLWQVIPYALMLGAADRFLGFALFGGQFIQAMLTIILGALAGDPGENRFGPAPVGWSFGKPAATKT